MKLFELAGVAAAFAVFAIGASIVVVGQGQESQKQPPCKAVLLSQQDEILKRDEMIVRLQKALLERSKQLAEPEIVKEAGGQSGQGWDYDRLMLRPVPPSNPPAQAPPKP